MRYKISPLIVVTHLPCGLILWGLFSNLRATYTLHSQPQILWGLFSNLRAACTLRSQPQILWGLFSNLRAACTLRSQPQAKLTRRGLAMHVCPANR